MRKLSVFISLATCLLLGCSDPNSVDTGAGAGVFDPKIPGGTIGNTTEILNISSFSADASQVGKITLTWKNPSQYMFTAFEVHIYRKSCNYLTDSICTLTAPTSSLSSASAYEVYSGQLETFIDTGVTESTEYSYYAYIKLNSSYSSSEVKLTAAAAKTSNSFNLGTTSTFWPNISWSYGGFPNPSVTLGTLQYSTSSQYWYNSVSNTIESVPGRISMASNGLALFYSDTSNNRIIVFTKQTSMACSMLDTTSDTYQACIAQSWQEPFTASQVLGQPDQYSNKDCSQHYSDGTAYNSGLFVPTTLGDPDYKRCLTKPSGVHYDGTNLIVADSGNNRVVVYKNLEVGKGCDPQVVYGQTNSTVCDIDIFIGKKSSYDQNSYAVASDGLSSLNNPLDVTVLDGDLYIADSGNNRVVRASSFSNSGLWQCDSISWKSSICSFSAVFGQPDYVTSSTFLSIYNSDNTIVGSGLNMNDLTTPNESLLKRKIRNPVSIKITDSGFLLTSSYEGFSVTNSMTGTPMTLMSRIVAFDLSKFSANSPQCNAATYSSGGCDASYVVGQSDFKTIPVWPVASGTYYSNISYGLEYVTGISTYGTKMIAVDGITSSSSVQNSIFVWSDWKSNTSSGKKYDYFIQDPSGAVNPNITSQMLPDLKAITDTAIDKVNNKVYISDPLGGKFYEIKSY